MGLLVPAGLALAALLPAIVALYFLRRRRPERTVSSTWLWRNADPEREANRPWQRLRPSWLLALQLLAMAALALAVARPFRWFTPPVGANTAVLIDASAAMRATDVPGGRFAAAQADVRRLIDGMAPGDRMSLILLGRTPQVLATDSQDRSALLAALAHAAPGYGDADLSAGLALAEPLVAGLPDARIVVVGNGRYLTDSGQPASSVPVRYIPVGGPAPNLAITAFGTAPAAGGGTQALAAVANFGPRAVTAPVQLWADGKFVGEATHTLGAGATTTFSWVAPSGASVLEARLPSGDDLGVDDSAWTLAPGAAGREPVLLVTAGDPFLRAALAAVPGVDLTVQKPAAYAPGGFALVVFDGWLPASLPPGAATLEVDPPGPRAAVTAPIVAAGGNPLLDNVDTAGLVVTSAVRTTPPAGAEVLWRSGSLPLLWTADGASGGHAVLAFSLSDSDLPLLEAFPILVSQLTAWLLPPDPVAPASVQPGQAVTVRPYPGATALRITGPDGRTTDWPVGDSGLPFTGTGLPGVYHVRETLRGGTTLDSSFTVNLFSALASDLTPASRLPASAAPSAPPAAPRRAPRNLWPWAAALALAAVGGEWWLYRRGLGAGGHAL